MARTESRDAPPDDLLAPTLQDYRPPPQGARRPWRLGSQVYVAFFGGVLAAGAIAYLNALRLRVPVRGRLIIVAAAAVGLAGVIAFAATVIDDDTTAPVRVVVQLISVLAWGVMFLVQRPYDRIYLAFSDAPDDEEYESLIGPGLIAVIVLGFLLLTIVFAVAPVSQ